MTRPEPTVLIADADEESAGELAEALAGLGVDVVFAASARAAFEAIHGGVDAVFLDVASEALRGPELLATIRERWWHLPIVAVGDAEAVDGPLHALRHGCADWIGRPPSADAVRDALGRIATAARRDRAAGTTARLTAAVRSLAERARSGELEPPAAPPDVALLLELCAAPDAERLRSLLDDRPTLERAVRAAVEGDDPAVAPGAPVTALGEAIRDLAVFRPGPLADVGRARQAAWRTAAALAAELAADRDDDPVAVAALAALRPAGELLLLRALDELAARHPTAALPLDEALAAVADLRAPFGRAVAEHWGAGDEAAAAAGLQTAAEYDREALGDPLWRRLHVLNLADRLVEGAATPIYADRPGPSTADSFAALEIEDPEAQSRWDERARELHRS